LLNCDYNRTLGIRRPEIRAQLRKDKLQCADTRPCFQVNLTKAADVIVLVKGKGKGVRVL